MSNWKKTLDKEAIDIGALKLDRREEMLKFIRWHNEQVLRWPDNKFTLEDNLHYYTKFSRTLKSVLLIDEIRKLMALV